MHDLAKNQKIALVTASTQGIGKAIGLALLKKGCYVFFNYAHSDDNKSKLESELASFDGKYSIIKADLSTIDGVDVLVKEIKTLTDKLDFIILNTAITCRSSFEEITLDQWNNVLNTNLTVPFFTLQALSSMIRNDGRIIFIGALMGLIPHAVSLPYSVSKAGLTMLAQSLVKVFKDRTITVNVVAPGFIDTPWQLTKAQDHRKRIEEKIALGRFGKPEEVASTCIHIIENQYINGAIIRLDGGYDLE